MRATVESIKELGDGSALVTLDLDEEAITVFIERGFNAILEDYIDEQGKQTKTNANP